MTPESNDTLEHKAYVVIPPLPEEPPLEAIYPKDTYALKSIPDERLESVTAIEPEVISRLAAKEGPIAPYDLDDARTNTSNLENRFDRAEEFLVQGMKAADQVAVLYTKNSLEDKESTRALRDMRLEIAQSNINQLRSAVAEYEQRILQEIDRRFEVRNKINDMIAIGANLIKEEGLRSYNNTRRYINTDKEDLAIKTMEYEQAAIDAAKLHEKLLETQAELAELRAELEGHNVSLETFQTRVAMLPEERKILESNEEKAREEFFDAVFAANRKEFEDMGEEEPVLRRRKEIMEQADTPKIRDIVSDIKRNDKEMITTQASIESTLKLITNCVGKINKLENTARLLPAQIYQKHIEFEKAATFIKNVLAKRSESSKEKAEALGPAAKKEVELTKADAQRLGMYGLALYVQRVTELTRQRDDINEEDLSIEFSVQDIFPDLIDPFGQPVKIDVTDLNTAEVKSVKESTTEAHPLRGIKNFGKRIVEAVIGEQPQSAPTTKQITQG